MKLFKKIRIFASFALVLTLVLSIGVFATEIGKDTKPADFSERLEYALQGTVTGILMVFAVLTLLTLILYASKVVFYDIPKKKREKEQEKNKVSFEAPAPIYTPEPIEADTASVPDDTELAAVITAAIATMLEGEEYAGQFKSGFRVVSFKRSDSTGAWNKK